MAYDTSTPALILALHDHGGLGAVRSLARIGVPVYATHPPGRTPATRSRLVRDRFPWSIDEAAPADTVEFLLDVGRRIGRPTVLFPSEDVSSILVAEHADALRERFILPEVPVELPRSLIDKRQLFEICRRTDIPVPETLAPATLAEVEQFARAASFPVVIKAIHGWRLRGRSERKTIIVHSADELLENHRVMAVDDDLNAVLQEYIPGGPDAVWIYAAYANSDAEPLVAFVGNKLREYPVDTGVTTIAVNVANPDVAEAGRRFVGEVGYRGIIDLDFRYDARDGQYKPLDFNPRPGANFRTFVDEDGIDVVRAAYLDLTGQRFSPAPPRIGRKWMVENWDVAAGRRYIAEGRLTPWAWGRSLHGVQETAWFAHEDLLPFVAMLVQLVVTAWGWARRRLGPGRSARPS